MAEPTSFVKPLYDPGAPAADWFTSDEDKDQSPGGWRLDVVTLLAVIGEYSIADHAQIITASAMCLLPRIIPAPQALLKPSRPARLPEVNARITGVYSGVTVDSVGFFANIIHPLSEFKQAFGFRVLTIKHADPPALQELRKHPRAGLFSRWRSATITSSVSAPEQQTTNPPKGGNSGGNSGGRATGYSSTPDDPETGAPQMGITRRATKSEKARDWIAHPTLPPDADKRPGVPAKLYSPIHILAVFSTFLTFAIIGLAIYMQDGTAIISVSLVAITSSIVGLASWWSPRLMKRTHRNFVPPGDVVIRTREGAFLLIHCTEEVARELYSGTEECTYKFGESTARGLMGIGTFLLMVSVILLGNCSWYCQIAIGCSYIILNGCYWAMGLLPKDMFWDLSRYKIDTTTPGISKNAHVQDRGSSEDDDEAKPSFTRTLWYVIRETKSTAWVGRNGAAPETPQWRRWLREAEKAAADGDENWPAIARKDAIMKMTDGECDNDPISPIAETRSEHRADDAEQRAPAVEVGHPPHPA